MCGDPGPLIIEWGQLPGLVELNLSHNSLTGQLPLQWAQNFTDLTMLDLSNNLLASHVPTGLLCAFGPEPCSSRCRVTGPVSCSAGLTKQLHQLSVARVKTSACLTPLPPAPVLCVYLLHAQARMLCGDIESGSTFCQCRHEQPAVCCV